jgi:hypothetical protein
MLACAGDPYHDGVLAPQQIEISARVFVPRQAGLSQIDEINLVRFVGQVIPLDPNLRPAQPVEQAIEVGLGKCWINKIHIVD